MLADNRDVIADILAGVGLHASADTVRWALTFDATPISDELTELERLREFVEVVDGVLGRDTVNDGKREHPAAKILAIRTAREAVTP